MSLRSHSCNLSPSACTSIHGGLRLITSPRLTHPHLPPLSPPHPTALNRPRLPLQPRHRPLIPPLEELPRLIQHLDMVRVEPLLLPRREQALVDELRAHGHHGHVFEAEPGLFAEGVRRFDLAAHDDVWGVCQWECRGARGRVRERERKWGGGRDGGEGTYFRCGCQSCRLRSSRVLRRLLAGIEGGVSCGVGRGSYHRR